MRPGMALSLLLHGGVGLLMVLSGMCSPERSRAQLIYPVDLVSLPAPAASPAVTNRAPARVSPEKPLNIPARKSAAPAPPVTAPRSDPPARPTGSRVNINRLDFPFNYYLTLLQNRLQQSWQPPYQAAALAETVSAEVRFRIDRAGRISAVEVTRSSGRFIFDQAARRAVWSVDPLPPLPESYQRGALTVHIEFESVKEE